MAEYFLAACALQDACSSAETFCLLPAAFAETANDATRTVASVEINSFFMVASPLPPNAPATSQRTFSFRLSSCQFVQKPAVGQGWLLRALLLLLAFELCFIGSNEGANLVGHIEQLEPLLFV